MKGISILKSSFMELTIKIFLPILLIILLVEAILFFYLKSAKNRDIPNYKEKVNIHFSIISIVITLVLIAITVCFAVNFINIMKAKNIIEHNKIIYYIIIITPLIPFTYILYLIINFVKMLSNNEIKEDITKEKIENINSLEKLNTMDDISDDIEVL